MMDKTILTIGLVFLGLSTLSELATLLYFSPITFFIQLSAGLGLGVIGFLLVLWVAIRKFREGM
ncbi:MAG: hypothetical protein Q7S68_01080 [Deltaproteobacteria bacterium]|nr:hypothetical protein [Deltaproteobacteria bacterium]